ncbi:hypothetical protein V1527DRAFT_264606 [Lipomyces starkeyi]
MSSRRSRRWTFYTLMIWSGILLTGFIFTVPETYHRVLLRKKAVGLRKETGNENLKAPIENITRSVLGTVLVSLIGYLFEPSAVCKFSTSTRHRYLINPSSRFVFSF